MKLRGFRIELGEIEAVIAAQPGVEQVAVVVREDRVKRLVAYVVGVVDGLRNAVADLLPDYMVPAAFVRLESLPMTANSKLDQKALPEPEFDNVLSFVAPRDDVERVLCGIWSEVLGVERVGVEDNFFDLGGDSILSIQVVSRARRAGIDVSSRDVFLRQTIATLAAGAGHGTTHVAADQGLVTGPLKATPIQKWFFENYQAAPHRFGMSMAFELPDGTDPKALRIAVGAVVRQHDALRMRFDTGGAVLAEEVDVFEVVEDWDDAVSQAQSGMDLSVGPLTRVLFDGKRLAWIAHHTVVDGVSWRILLADLRTAYQQAAQGEPVDLGEKTTSIRQWTDRLHEHVQSGGFDDQRGYWQHALDGAVVDIPVDGTKPRRQSAVVASLDEETTHALIQHVPSVYRTQINDVLLAALARALRRWTGSDRVAVNLESHGREELFDDIDLSRTVGWFTSIHPVALRLPEHDDWKATILAVKEQLRAVPDRGVGYGALRYLAEGTTDAIGAPSPRISFNYLGRFDTGGAGFYGSELDVQAGDHDPAAARPHQLDIVGAVQDGRLTFTWIYSQGVHRKRTIQQQANRLIRELAAFVRHCTTKNAGGCSPSDFPLVRLDQTAVDRIAGNGTAVEDVYPLTPLQAGMVFHALAGQESVAYLEQMTFVAEGVTDVEAFAQAWQRVVDRSDALRAGIAWRDVPEPVQVVHRTAVIPVSVQDWREGKDLDRLLAEDRAVGMDLSKPPLMRLALFRMPGDAVRVLWTFHHVLLDGWSTAAFLHDVMGEYTGTGSAQRRPYGDYMRWLAERDAMVGKEFWRKSLAGFDQRVALPYDRAPGGAHVSQSSGQIPVELSAGVSAQVARFARDQRITVNAVVQGAWALLLSHYSGARDIVFGATTSGRPVDLPGADDILGLFINTLPVRVHVEPDRHVGDWLRGLQDQQVESRQYDYLSLTDIPTDLPAGTSLFDSLIVFENYPGDAGSGGVTVRDVHAVESTNYPLTLIAYTGERTGFVLAYDPGLFDTSTAGRIAAHFESLVTAMVRVVDRAIGDIPLLDDAERDWVLYDWNDQWRANVTPETYHGLFEAQVARTPDAVAVTYGELTLTYAELDAAAAKLARHLAGRGVRPESRVAIMLPRSADMIISVFAVLKAGGAYVPVDPAYPADRIAYMITDSGADVVVTQQDLVNDVPGAPDRVVVVDRSLDGPPMPRRSVSTANTAYIIYTSGSTGRPKGAVVTHRGLAAFVASQTSRYQVDETARVLHSSSPSFDASVLEILLALPVGGTLVIPADSGPVTGEQLVKLVTDERVTHLFLPTALLASLPDADLPEVRVLITGGETLSADVVRRWAPGRQMFNAYGPTEATVVVTADGPLPVDEVAGSAPSIGTPFADMVVYVLDDRLRPVPAGVPGELYVSGPGLARGYFGSPGVTSERFVANPFEPGRMYRSGDVVRRRPDGRLDYVARADHQVKVRGFRIELGEIENALSRHPDVAQAVITVRDDGPNGRELVAYVVTERDTTAEPGALREYLRESLPHYMIPAVFVPLDALPLTGNGKLDRRALPAPDRAGGSAGRGPVTPNEEALCALFGEVLGVARVSAEDDFFDLGGHSLSATRLVASVRSTLGVELSVRAVFEHPTVAALAVHLGTGSEGSLDVLLPLRAEGSRPALFCVHPAGGVSWCYAGLLSALPDRPVYGLQARGLTEPGALPATIAEMAADYVREIQAVQPHGPYHLLGWSLGGAVAHRIATRLQQQGEQVELLALMDAYPGMEGAEQAGEQETLGQMLATLGCTTPVSSRQEAVDAIVAQNDALASLGEVHVRGMLDVYLNNNNLIHTLTPDTFDGDVLFFTATEGRAATTPESGAWAAYVTGRTENHDIACEHLDMTQPGPLAEVAEVLAGRLR
ncbi:MAG: amino acid adenylation domain-containing protein [Kibdelosporangium sp.]